MKEPRCIVLTKGFVAIIDAKDFRRVNRYSWHVHFSRGNKREPGQPYARATINGRKVYMHRFIMEAPEYMQVDHGNHCTLDNRRSNLEVTDHVTNQQRRRKVPKKVKRARGGKADAGGVIPAEKGGAGSSPAALTKSHTGENHESGLQDRLSA